MEGQTSHQRSELLERERELAAVAHALDGAVGGGTGALLFLAGEGGIGRTAVLTAAVAGAKERGLEVLRARGGELERDMTFGVARQLLEATVHRADPEVRAALLAGAARHAAPMLGASDGSSAEMDEPSLVHALFWVLANLADRTPLLVALDDAQWSDAASLRLLAYLARRLDELPVVVVVAAQSGEPEAPQRLLDELALQPASQRIELSPLTAAATAELVRRDVEPGADDAFCAAVHEAARGNPFLALEAARALAAGDDPAGLRSEGVAARVLGRLDRLPAAAALARAVALLGPDAALGVAAPLAGLKPDLAAEAADGLAAARILEPGRPLQFVHPVVRSTVYASIRPAERAQMHARAARALRDSGASPLRVVPHLMAAEPVGDADVVGALCAAAQEEPDPRRAAVALRRALDEPPPAERRAEILLSLGQAEMRAFDPAAIEHLTEARDRSTDPEQRLMIIRALARAYTLHPDPAEAREWVRRELEAIEGPGADVSPDARQARFALTALEVIRTGVSRDRARTLREEATTAATPAERYLLAALAYKASDHGTAQDGVELAELALKGGLDAEGIRGTGAILVLAALEFADDLERADEVAQAQLALARELGDVSGSALALTVQADVAVRSGALTDAESGAREALELADQHGLAWAEPVAIATLLEALGELGRGDEADRVLADRELNAWQQGSARAAVYLHARGRLRLAQNRNQDALDDFRRAGEIMRRYEVDHPAVQLWRSGAADALLALGDVESARKLAEEELELARPFGARHSIGSALRVLGLATGGAEGLRLLRESVAVLAESPARLERARAYVDLGAALRRTNERAAAREPLRTGLDLAHQCGATRLGERAQQELEATGARPRRRAISGIEALTPSERRVAEMGAEGLSNREIAQALFLSVRTIENQLRQVYLKLGIGSRRELPDALSGALIER